MIVDREAKPVSLIRLVVGVLPQNNHLHPVEGAGVECGKNLTPGRVDCFGGIFVPYKRGQRLEIGLVKFAL